jgi:hypothetical protein
MNLGNMLAAGKSFISGGAALAYRENKRVYVPKFNAGKNPFVTKTPEPAAAASAPVKKIAAPVVAKPTTLPALAPTPLRATNWANKLNPFRAAAPVATAPMPTVQPELLSLSDVKVIHNDLTDADVEVVPAKSRGAALPEVPMLPPARAPWEFMGERLMKSA